MTILYVSDVNECTANPCQNGANCSNTVGAYQCMCTEGWTGEVCSQGTVQYSERLVDPIFVKDILQQLNK